MKAPVTAICIGQARPFRDDEKSAFVKSAVDGPIAITTLGIEGDEQADQKHHGGVDMAVHHYPHDHYAWWEKELGGHELLKSAPAFGENLVMNGMTESDVHIGDRFKLGSAVLEVSQPRKPCWKIEHRFGRKGMVKSIMKHHNCGWYYRVLEEGEAKAGDTLERISTGRADWSIARAFAVLHTGEGTQEELVQLSEMSPLSKVERARAASKLR